MLLRRFVRQIDQSGKKSTLACLVYRKLENMGVHLTTLDVRPLFLGDVTGQNIYFVLESRRKEATVEVA